METIIKFSHLPDIDVDHSLTTLEEGQTISIAYIPHLKYTLMEVG